MGSTLMKVLANPIVKYIAQLHEPSAGAAATAKRALQAIFHLPHNGFAQKVLHNLPVLGLNECVTVEREATVAALSAARRLENSALCYRVELEEAFSNGDLAPLAHLAEALKPQAARRYIPRGWDSPDLSFFVQKYAAAERATRGPAGTPPKGKCLVRAVFPLDNDASVAKELGRRVRLWLPLPFAACLDDQQIGAFLPSVRGQAKRNIVGWLRLLQNAFCTRKRFTGVSDACHACGAAHSDRLRHIVQCKPFWRPIFRAFGQSGVRTGIAELLLGPHAVERAGVAFRAHAMASHNSEITWANAVNAASR